MVSQNFRRPSETRSKLQLLQCHLHAKLMSPRAAETLALVVLLCICLYKVDGQPQYEPITYARYYHDANARANVCKIAHSSSSRTIDSNSTGYVPFIGTSIARDSQLLVLRLFYSSLDFPVKHFVVVVPERAMNPPRGGMWYELEHLKDYAKNVVIITCTDPPSVAEGWNAGGHAQQQEPAAMVCCVSGDSLGCHAACSINRRHMIHRSLQQSHRPGVPFSTEQRCRCQHSYMLTTNTFPLFAQSSSKWYHNQALPAQHAFSGRCRFRKHKLFVQAAFITANQHNSHCFERVSLTPDNI
jgi:hypothetical protein